MFGRQGGKASARNMTPRGTVGAREESVLSGSGGSDREASRARGPEAGQAGSKGEAILPSDVGKQSRTVRRGFSLLTP
jgi:hypothetical protein